MPDDEEEITENIIRVMEMSPAMTAPEYDLEDNLETLGFDKKSLKDLGFAINKNEYFKPLGVGLIPDDVADCETVFELIELVKKELNNEMPARRARKSGKETKPD